MSQNTFGAASSLQKEMDEIKKLAELKKINEINDIKPLKYEDVINVPNIEKKKIYLR